VMGKKLAERAIVCKVQRINNCLKISLDTPTFYSHTRTKFGWTTLFKALVHETKS